jgi:hypothetical protein
MKNTVLFKSRWLILLCFLCVTGISRAQFVDSVIQENFPDTTGIGSPVDDINNDVDQAGQFVDSTIQANVPDTSGLGSMIDGFVSNIDDMNQYVDSVVQANEPDTTGMREQLATIISNIIVTVQNADSIAIDVIDSSLTLVPEENYPDSLNKYVIDAITGEIDTLSQEAMDSLNSVNGQLNEATPDEDDLAELDSTVREDIVFVIDSIVLVAVGNVMDQVQLIMDTVPTQEEIEAIVSPIVDSILLETDTAIQNVGTTVQEISDFIDLVVEETIQDINDPLDNAPEAAELIEILQQAGLDYSLALNAVHASDGFADVTFTLENTGLKPFTMRGAALRIQIGTYNSTSNTPLYISEVVTGLTDSLFEMYSYNDQTFFEEVQLGYNEGNGTVSYILYDNGDAINNAIFDIEDELGIYDDDLERIGSSGFPILPGASAIIGSIRIPISQSSGTVSINFAPNSELLISTPIRQNVYDAAKATNGELAIEELTITSSDDDNTLCAGQEITFTSNIAKNNNWLVDGEVVSDENNQTFTTSDITVNGTYVAAFSLFNQSINTTNSSNAFDSLATNAIVHTLDSITVDIAGIQDICLVSDTFLYIANANLADNFSWTITDGTFLPISSVTDDSLSIRFDAAGDFNLNLVVSNSDASLNCASVTIDSVQTIFDNVSATLNAIDDLCQTGEQVYEATTANADSSAFNWSFGGVENTDFEFVSGSSASSVTPSVKWITANSFNVSMTVANINTGVGCADATSNTLSQLVNPSASATIDAIDAVCETGNAIYIATVVSADPEGYTWSFTGTEEVDYDFANSTTATSVSPELTWNTSNSFDVNLIVLNANTGSGCTPDTATAASQLVNPTATAGINAFDTVCETGSTTYSVVLSNVDSITAAWTFSGVEGTDFDFEVGSDANSIPTTVNWLTAGDFTVDFTINNIETGAGCDAVNATQLSQNVSPTATAVIEALTQLCEGGTTIYTAVLENADATSHNWTFSGVEGVNYNFENSTTSASAAPEVTWLTPGSFTVDLTVNNILAYTGCSTANAVQLTQIVDTAIVVSIDDVDDICQTGSTFYSATVTSGNVAAYAWTFPGVEAIDYNFVDGDASSENPTVEWLTADTKSIGLSVTNADGGSGCTGETATPIEQIVNPTVEVSIDVVSDICLDSTSIYAAVVANGSAYAWTFSGVEGVDFQFENSTNSNTESPVLKWLTSGNITADLNVTNVASGSGCVAVDATQVTSLVNEVTLTVNATDSAIANEVTTVEVVATDLNNNIFTYSWNSSVSNSEIVDTSLATINVTPIANPTSYDVVVTNDLGCVASASHSFEVLQWVSLNMEVLLEAPYSGAGVMTASIVDLLEDTYGVNRVEDEGLLGSGLLADESTFPQTNAPVPANAVDLVSISLRSAASGDEIAINPNGSDASASGIYVWLLSDGSLTNFSTGTGAVRAFSQEMVQDDEYYVVVRHRNHLTAMTVGTPLSFTTGLVSLASDSVIYGSTGSFSFEDGLYLIGAGDADGSNGISSSDRDPVKRDSENGFVGYVNTRGEHTDVNLDGLVNSLDINLVDKNNAKGYFSEVPQP